MIHQDTFSFLGELKNNNHKPWFDQNKPRYIAAREKFIEFLTEFMAKANKIEPVPVQDPAKCIYRIYRDVRFSPNKDPYKSHMAALISRGDQPRKCMFYIHLEPGESMVGGGIYAPEPDVLKAIRREIHFHGDKLQQIVSSKKFKEKFGGLWDAEKLKKAPAGYAPDHPYIDFLRYKHFVVSRTCTDDFVCSDKFLDFCVDTFQASLEFYAFLDSALANQ